MINTDTCNYYKYYRKMLCLKRREKDTLYLLHTKIFVKFDDWMFIDISDPELAYDNFDDIEVEDDYDRYHRDHKYTIKIKDKTFGLKGSSEDELLSHLVDLIGVRDKQLVKELKTILKERDEEDEEEQDEGEWHSATSLKSRLIFANAEAYDSDNYQQQELYSLVIKHAGIITELNETSKITQLAGKIVDLKSALDEKSATIVKLEQNVKQLRDQNATLRADLQSARDENSKLRTEKIDFKINLMTQLRAVIDKS